MKIIFAALLAGTFLVSPLVRAEDKAAPAGEKSEKSKKAKSDKGDKKAEKADKPAGGGW
jgi:hypothetical protein